MYTLPQDSVMLLSYVNLKLRDEFDSLEELCLMHNITKDELIGKLALIDYHYDAKTKQFK